MKTDAIILDVDGTLWNTTPLVSKAWMRALEELGYPREITAEQLMGLFGKPMDVIANALISDISDEDREKVMRRCIKYEEDILRDTHENISYEGVADTIRELSARIPFCIVSNCQKGYIELTMDKLGITEFITDHECFGNNGLSKADNIRQVVLRNHFLNAVYVGDIQGDCDSAHEAGIRFVHASYGFGKAEDADFVISSFSELIQLAEYGK